MQASNSLLGVDGFLELPPEHVGKGWWHGVPDLPVLALDVARKTVAVREALCTQANVIRRFRKGI
jgi:hypothetical protein